MAIDWNLLRRRKLFQLSQCTCYSIGSGVNGIVQLTVWENVITRHIDSEEMLSLSYTTEHIQGLFISSSFYKHTAINESEPKQYGQFAEIPCPCL